jgi:hypothetical protein
VRHTQLMAGLQPGCKYSTNELNDQQDIDFSIGVICSFFHDIKNK